MDQLFSDVFFYCLYMPSLWFKQLLDRTMGGYYIAALFVVMTTGFLLKRFGSALSLGSDKVATKFKRKGDE